MVLEKHWVMLPGKYEFNTRELMEIISGKLNLKLQNFDLGN